MNVLIYYILPLAIAFRYLNRIRIKNLTISAENKLTRIKGDLKLLAMDRSVDIESDEYNTLQLMLVNAIANINQLTVWKIISGLWKNKSEDIDYINNVFIEKKDGQNVLKVNYQIQEILSQIVGVYLVYVFKKSITTSIVYYLLLSIKKIFKMRDFVKKCRHNVENALYVEEFRPILGH